MGHTRRPIRTYMEYPSMTLCNPRIQKWVVFLYFNLLEIQPKGYMNVSTELRKLRFPGETFPNVMKY